MSVYIESLENNQQNNISKYLSTCETPKGFAFQQIIAKVKTWENRSRQRKQLAKLDARMLADIGITAEQVTVEVAKPFWKQ
jgi:uncharacterized protein YjiS (DUF1127 family)